MTRRTMNRWLMIALALMTAAVLSAPATWAGGARIAVQISEPFEVDGELYPAGQLSVRELRAYTPTSTLNEVWAGDERIGMLISKRSEDAAQSDSVEFLRHPEGHLVLVGYTLRDSGTHVFNHAATQTTISRLGADSEQRTTVAQR